MLHKFMHNINECELPKQFTFPFCYEPHPLIVEAAHEVSSLYSKQLHTLGEGKMMGVLLVRDTQQNIGYVAAYSGEFADNNNFFVPPIVDYLIPDGYFKTHEAEISQLNAAIYNIENSSLMSELKDDISSLKAQKDKSLAEAKAQYKLNKALRDELRSKGSLTPDDEQRMIRESQHEKAEIHRLDMKLKGEIGLLEQRLSDMNTQVETMKEERRVKSDSLQRWLFQQYVLLNARGEQRRVDVIFSDRGLNMPPSGAGDCCAPRLLQYAYQHCLQPLAMGEFWVGPDSKGSLRCEGNFYPSCQKRCVPILSFMLQGLDVEENPLKRAVISDLPVVYEDKWIVVVNKPGGLQSVPGLTTTDSVATRLSARYASNDITPAHRLDQFTSGLLIVAKNRDVLALLHRQFENREVKKRYVALLEHYPSSKAGVIDLPIGYDLDDSRRRTVDKAGGRPAVTHFSIIGEMNEHPLVEYLPETGRTHQLRIHSAHPEGLATPIVGDSLYGKKGDKMYLCSCGIKLKHPVTSELLDIEIPKDDWFR